MAASMAIRDETPIDPTPNAATTLREKCAPSTASTSALVSGSSTINQSTVMPLRPHFAQRIRVQGFKLMVQLQHQGQTHRNFGGCHSENKEKDNLSIGLLPSRPSNHERQTCCVQHNLERHQH